jgi:hypothetical protein
MVIGLLTLGLCIWSVLTNDLLHALSSVNVIVDVACDALIITASQNLTSMISDQKPPIIAERKY